VPELGDPDIREVPAHAWRAVHQLRADDVFIVALVRSGDLRASQNVAFCPSIREMRAANAPCNRYNRAVVLTQ
jgi:hypothetical protein